MLTDVLRRERVTEGEVRQAARVHGFGGIGELAAVVLETDGSLSVVATSKLGDGAAMDGVAGWRIRSQG